MSWRSILAHVVTIGAIALSARTLIDACGVRGLGLDYCRVGETVEVERRDYLRSRLRDLETRVMLNNGCGTGDAVR